jgi:hypothetical protein
MENSLSQLEGGWRGRGRSVYKADFEGIMTHMEVAGGYVNMFHIPARDLHVGHDPFTIGLVY